MKKVTFGLFVVMSCICVEIRVEASDEISESTNRQSQQSFLNANIKSEESNQIPSYSELKKQYENDSMQKEKTKELLVKMKTRIEELTTQILELSETNAALERENSSLSEQIQKFQSNSIDNDDKVKLLNTRILNLEQEKEELLQKLFDHQMNTQEIKSVSFELNSLLNKITTEDEITQDCIKFLKNLNDTNDRVNQILKSIKDVELNSERESQITSILEELETIQSQIQRKLDFYNDHEIALMNLCNKNKKTQQSLDQIKNQLIEEQQKYPEIANLQLEKNLMNSINVVKAFRQNKTAKQAAGIKLLEKKLYEYLRVCVKKSDLQRLEHKTRDFSDNIAKIKELSEDFLKKSKQLEELKHAVFQTIKDVQQENDNRRSESKKKKLLQETLR